MKRLAGKVAIITGAGRGIGRAYTLAMAEQGANVVVNDLGSDVHGRGGKSEAPAEEVVREAHRLGAKAVASYEDVASFEGARRTVAMAVERFGRLDILITNAGIERRGNIYELTENDWDAVQGVHAKGTFNYVRHAAPVMIKQKSGTIINITSGAAWGGSARLGPYAAGKGAIISLMLVSATELKPFGINVNCLSPGLTGTRLVDDFFSDLKEARGMTDAEIRARVGTPQPPENMAPLAVFLSSDEGRNITGRIFEVAGDRINVVSPPTRREAYVRPGGWKLDDLTASFPRSF